MTREIDVLANLTLSSGDRSVSVKAEGGRVILSFRGMSFGGLCRELRELDRLRVLDRLWSLARRAGLRFCIRYGPLRLPMPGPAVWRAVIRLRLLLSRSR